MHARLSILRSLVPIARIAFSMSVEHDAMGEMKKVLVYLATAYRLMCRHCLTPELRQSRHLFRQ